MDWLKDLIPAGTVLVLLGIWAGKIQQRQNDHEKSEKERLQQRAINERTVPLMTVEACKAHIEGCGKMNSLQFASGERQFQEIKKLIAENNKASNDRHTAIMSILLEMNKQ